MVLVKLFINILINQITFSEYRVYQYYIKPKDPTLSQSNPQVVISSLNPISYQSYHGGTLSHEINLLRTWICPGHTGDMKEYCSSPYKKLTTLLNELDKKEKQNE